MWSAQKVRLCSTVWVKSGASIDNHGGAIRRQLMMMSAPAVTTVHMIPRAAAAAVSGRICHGARFFSSIDIETLPTTVALLGPPNAGKSTLYNRLLDKESNKAYRLASDKRRKRNMSGRLKATAGQVLAQAVMASNVSLAGTVKNVTPSASTTIRPAVGKAIVSAVPGTTRDRRDCIGRIGGTYFRLMDTAGVDGERILQEQTSQQKADHSVLLVKSMMHQTMQAARQADIVFLMFDAKLGAVTTDLMETMRWLRKVQYSTKQKNKSKSNKENQQQQQQKPPKGKDDQQGGTNDGTSTTTSKKMEKKIVLLANKLEGESWNYQGSPVLELLDEVNRLGFGDPIPISAEHGEGLAEIAAIIEEMNQFKDMQKQEKQEKEEKLKEQQEQVQKQKQQTGVEKTADEVDGFHDELKNEKEDDEDVVLKEKPLQLAILGRQNVGKSTLVNALLQVDRVITGATPGLTRDAITVPWVWNGRKVQIVDTAGIRKPSQRDHTAFPTVEDQAVEDAMRAMKLADVAVLVLDADARLLHKQELVIADAVLKEGRALVVAANKMDLILEKGEYDKNEFAADVRRQVEARFPMLRKTPIVPMSSLTGESVNNLMPVVFRARDRWARKITTAQLNKWIKEVAMGTKPPMVNGRPAKIKYILQTKGRPPTFLLFCNSDELPESYIRYLTRHFQDTFEMFGMEVRLAVKKAATSNPYDDPSKRTRTGGTGIGGKEMRKKRLYKSLQKTGAAPVKGKGRRKTSHSKNRFT